MTQANLPSRTFGIEIEIKDLTELAAVEALSAGGINVERSGYTHRVSSRWKVLYDGSLSGTSCEIVSPVLAGETGIEETKKVAKILAQAGGRIDRQCGLHIHVGTQGMTPNDVGMVLSRYARFESTIDSFMPRSRRENNNQFCQSIKSGVNSRIDNQVFGNIRNVVSAMGSGRYFKVNMQAYNRHRTIEFRQHSGTCNANKIENWIRFILGFVEASINQNVLVDASRIQNSQQNRTSSGRQSYYVERNINRIIMQFVNAPERTLTYRQIAGCAGVGTSSVPTYISRIRSSRECIIKKVRGVDAYKLISTREERAAQNNNIQVETQRAARQISRVRGVGHIENDNVFRGIPGDVVSFYNERIEDFNS